MGTLSLGVQPSQLSCPSLVVVVGSLCNLALSPGVAPPVPFFLSQLAVSVHQCLSLYGLYGEGLFLCRFSGYGEGSGWNFLPFTRGCCSPPQFCTTLDAS